MNRHLALLPWIFAFATLPASAILDTDGNGLSDLWEGHYKVGVHLSAILDPGSDEDGDGWTNVREDAAGTDPFDPTPPNGLLCPGISHINPVYSYPAVPDPEPVEDPDPLTYIPPPVDPNLPPPVLVSHGSVSVTWPTISGKQYTLLYSLDRCDGPWDTIEQPFIGDGSIETFTFVLEESPIKFWRVKVEDVDTDGDGLTNAEEYEFGTDPTNLQTIAGIDDLWLARHFTNLLLTGGPATIEPNADPDYDGLTNAQEAISGTNPHLADTDGDGSSDGNEFSSGHDPKSNQSYPPVWVHTQRKSFHALGYISSSRDWGGTVYHDWSSISAPGTCASLLVDDCPFPAVPPDNNSHFTYDDGFAPFLVDSSGDRPHPGWSTQLTQSRFWLKTKPAPDADLKIRLLRVTNRKVIETNLSEIILTPDFEPLEVLIHAGQTFSDPIDALPTFTQVLEDGKTEHVVTTLLPFELMSDLNNDGKINFADSRALSKAMMPGATSGDKAKAVEYILPDNSMSNGAWDSDDQDGNICFHWPSYENLPIPPVVGEMNDDAIAIALKVPDSGVAWFTHEAIENLDFFTDKECNNHIDIELGHPFHLSTHLPERLWIAVKAGYTGNAGETVEGTLTLHVGKSTSEEWAATDLPLTVVPDFGCKKFFEAARNYIFERNTQIFVWDYYMPDRYNPDQIFRLCVMREEATTVKAYDAFANNKKGIGAVALAAGVIQPTVIVNGNQCFFRAGYEEGFNIDLIFMVNSIADGCHGRVIITGATAGISSDNFDNTTKPARGSDLAGPDPIPPGMIAGNDGVLGTADDTLNPRAGNPGGKFFSLTGTTWNFAAGQATGTNAVGGLSTNYDSDIRRNLKHQMVGRVPCSESGKGCIFTATEIDGVGQAPAFAAAAKRSGNQMLSPSTDILAQELFILDSGDGSLALDHIDPVGNLCEAYLGRKSATGFPYYVNNYIQFWATEPRP